MLFNKSSAVNVDNWKEQEFLRGKKSLILSIILNNSLMDEFESQEKWNLRRKELSSMSCSSDKDGHALV